MEIEVIMSVLFGILIGCAVTILVLRVRAIGALRIDRSDPDGPYLFLELAKDVDPVSTHKYVILKVKNENFITQN